MSRLPAYAVHILTASGVVFGFLSLIAVIEGDRLWAFTWLGISFLVDGIDGPLARWLRVKERTPEIDGGSMDYVIDFFTFVVIPAVMIWRWDLVPDGWVLITASAVLLAGCYSYANANFKTSDFYFVGFPAIWSLLLWYLVVLGAGQMTTLIIVLVCGGLTFVPTAYVHPFRVTFMRPVLVVASLLWVVSVAWLTWGVLGQGNTALAMPLASLILLITSLIFAGISIYRSAVGSQIG